MISLIHQVDNVWLSHAVWSAFPGLVAQVRSLNTSLAASLTILLYDYRECSTALLIYFTKFHLQFLRLMMRLDFTHTSDPPVAEFLLCSLYFYGVQR